MHLIFPLVFFFFVWIFLHRCFESIHLAFRFDTNENFSIVSETFFSLIHCIFACMFCVISACDLPVTTLSYLIRFATVISCSYLSADLFQFFWEAWQGRPKPSSLFAFVFIHHSACFLIEYFLYQETVALPQYIVWFSMVFSSNEFSSFFYHMLVLFSTLQKKHPDTHIQKVCEQRKRASALFYILFRFLSAVLGMKWISWSEQPFGLSVGYGLLCACTFVACFKIFESTKKKNKKE